MTTQNRQPLDPALAEIERKWKESDIPDLYAGRNGPVSRERARNIRAFLYPKPKLPTGKLERTSITGPNGPITIEIVQPVEGAPIGTLVYFHGGGYIVGDIDSHQAHAIRFANRARVVVVNVDYRLAPENPFPQGVEDAIAGAKWAHANLGRLGGAGKPLAVGGDSAGGNFAAVTAIKCRDAGIKLAAQTWEHAGAGDGWGGRDRYSFHQVSEVHTKAMAGVLGIEPEKVPSTVRRYGNIGPAAIPITLASVADELAAGDVVLCMGIGSGLNVGVIELQW